MPEIMDETKDEAETNRAIMQTPYDLLGGDAGVRGLANAFYDAMNRIPEAAMIRSMHKANLDTAAERLYEFLSGWLGGPPLYFRKYGTVCLTGPHAPYAIGETERDLWLLCMDHALDDVGAGDTVKDMLRQPLLDLADMMRSD